MTKKIILASFGSLGDLHPFIAVGLELKKLGYEAVLAVSEDQVEKVRTTGLKAHAIMPTEVQMNTDLGITAEEGAAAMMDDVNFVIDKILLGYLNESVKALEEIADDACAIVGTILTFPAAIIAEKCSLPFIFAALQPMSLVSVYHVPKSPDYSMLASPRFGLAGRVWNRMWLPLIRTELKRRFAKRINSVRNSHGLKNIRRAPFIEVEVDPIATLAMYSPSLAELQPDYPANTIRTGFPIFDSNSGQSESLDDELQTFLAAGPPPLIFTLGSFAIKAPSGFYSSSLEVAEALGVRAVLLTGGCEPLQSTDNILVRDYAPHSQIFPKASIIIHHGGVGTTGQAMRAGKPQLIVPHLGDQWDNGDRIKSLGIGDVLVAKEYSVESAIAAIDALLNDNSIHERAEKLGDKVRQETGAQTAAKTIIENLEKHFRTKSELRPN